MEQDEFNTRVLRSLEKISEAQMLMTQVLETLAKKLAELEKRVNEHN